MAKIKTDDLPVDETLGQDEMREVRGGTTPPTGSLAQLKEQLETELTATQGQTFSPEQAAELSQLGDSSQELASKMQMYNERFGGTFNTLSGILNSYHGAVKSIIGKIGQT